MVAVALSLRWRKLASGGKIDGVLANLWRDRSGRGCTPQNRLAAIDLVSLTVVRYLLYRSRVKCGAGPFALADRPLPVRGLRRKVNNRDPSLRLAPCFARNLQYRQIEISIATALSRSNSVVNSETGFYGRTDSLVALAPAKKPDLKFWCVSLGVKSLLYGSRSYALKIIALKI